MSGQEYVNEYAQKHIVWRANVICTYRKSGIARKTTVAYPELRLLVEFSRFCDRCGRDDNKNGGRGGLRCRKQKI